MRDADRTLLDGLALVTDLREDEWALVVDAVEKAGDIRSVGGQARVEIERAVTKARTLVAKHPGHADQSVHGGGRGKGGGASSASASAGGGGRDEPARAERMADQFDSMSAKANDPKTAVHWAEAATGARTVASARSKKEANQAVRDLNVKVLNAQINNNVGLDRAQGRRDGAEAAYEARFGEKHTASIEKSVEPVVKHPGHADQSVHGGGRRKGGASSSAPASSGGGGDNVPDVDHAGMIRDNNRKQQEAIDTMATAGARANERMAGHQNEMSQSIYGAKEHKGTLSMDDEAELMGISDTLSFAGESVMSLSPGRNKSYKELTEVRGTLKDADSAAQGIRNKNAQRAARRAIRLTDEEVIGLMKTHRESWSGVGGVFDE